MKKRRKNAREMQQGKKGKRGDCERDAEDQPDPSSREFLYDVVDEFHNEKQKLSLDVESDEASDADTDLNEDVLEVGASSSDSSDRDDNDDDSVDMRSDIEDADDGFLPSREAWGKKKSAYYDADDAEEIQGEASESDEDVAKMEEREALYLQRKMAEQIDEADLGLDLYQVDSTTDLKDKVGEERIVTDLSKLSRKEKLELLQKESPEFLPLVEDFKQKLMELRRALQPLMDLVNSGKIPEGDGAHYIRTKYQLYMNYMINGSFYLMMKVKNTPVHHHPVIKRLTTYRTLMKQLEPVDEKLKKHVEEILLKLNKGETIVGETEPALSAEKADTSEPTAKDLERKKRITPVKEKKRKTIAEMLASSDEESSGENEDFTMAGGESVSGKSGKRETGFPEGGRTWGRKRVTPDYRMEVTEKEGGDDDGKLEDSSRRAINYEIAKNKGLMPKRKKEQRNPRVKHKLKYRKALIRRKGQVRQPRTETQRYSGEHSGIRAGLKKGIKLKV